MEEKYIKPLKWWDSLPAGTSNDLIYKYKQSGRPEFDNTTDEFKKLTDWDRIVLMYESEAFEPPMQSERQIEYGECKLTVSPQFCPLCSPHTWWNNKTVLTPIQVCSSCGHEHKNGVQQPSKVVTTEEVYRWVSVEDELPEDNVWVMAAIAGKGVLIEMACYCRNCLDGHLQRTTGWLTSCGGHPETRITHWMKLPEPPKV